MEKGYKYKYECEEREVEERSENVSDDVNTEACPGDDPSTCARISPNKEYIFCLSHELNRC